MPLDKFFRLTSEIPHTVELNGIKFTGDALVMLLNLITQPNPDRWFNFRRGDNVILIEERVWPSEEHMGRGY